MRLELGFIEAYNMRILNKNKIWSCLVKCIVTCFCFLLPLSMAYADCDPFTQSGGCTVPISNQVQVSHEFTAGNTAISCHFVTDCSTLSMTNTQFKLKNLTTNPDWTSAVLFACDASGNNPVAKTTVTVKVGTGKLGFIRHSGFGVGPKLVCKVSIS